MFLTLTCFDENDNDFNFWNTCLYGNCSVLFLFLSLITAYDYLTKGQTLT